MPSTSDYLIQLQTDKTNLVSNLNTMGVEASNSETFTSLAPKVLDIQGSGGTTPTKGFTIDEWDNNGYATKITVYGMATIPNYFFGVFNNTYNNSITTSLKKVILPDNITSIGEFAFASAQLLELDKLPNSLTSIGKFSFNSCKKLKIKTIPDGVTSLPQSVFSFATDIKQISMNNIQTLYSNGSYTTVSPFNNCTGLKSVWIGNAITSSGLGRYAFNGCTSLAHIYINLPRTTVEGFTNYSYAFMNNTAKTGIIVCNDDEGFITKEEFDAIDWSEQ